MQRMLFLAAVAALALAAAPAAVAKEITKAEVCGTDGCVSVDDEAGRMALMTSGGSPTDPPHAAPYYEVQRQFATDDHGDGRLRRRAGAPGDPLRRRHLVRDDAPSRPR